MHVAGCQVRLIGPEELKAGAWVSNCALLILPGGADLPYCRALNGLGNSIIKGRHVIYWYVKCCRGWAELVASFAFF